MPTALKDLFDFTPGWPATFGGVRALRDFSVQAYCAYAGRMEAAGAILVGSTNSPVLGFHDQGELSDLRCRLITPRRRGARRNQGAGHRPAR